MSLQALPDFQQPVVAENLVLYYPFEGNGPFTLMPQRLTLAAKEGLLDFHLEFVRGEFPSRPPEPHGRLSFGLLPYFPLLAALELLRSEQRTATLRPAHFGRGTLRLVTLTAATEIPAELLQPVALHRSGAGQMRVQLALSPAAATFLRNALQGALLPLIAYVELEIAGVAPRLPAQVSFAPHLLLRELSHLADAEQRLPRAGIVTYFQRRLPDLPLTVTGAIAHEQQADFAEAMADHLIQRFGRFVPAPEIERGAYVQLDRWEGTAVAEFRWDLNVPLLATRQIGLTLNPFAAAQQVVQEQGIGAVYDERIVHSLPTGVHQLYISTNLPQGIPGVVSSGVRIRVPPRPRVRPHEIVRDLDDLEKSAETTLHLRLSFREALAYFYATFLVLDGAGGGQLLRGQEQWHEGPSLRLTAADYPVSLATVSATPPLLELAEVGGSYRWREGGNLHEAHFALDAAGQTTLLLPQGVEDARLSFTATSRQTGVVLRLDDLPFQDTQIGRYSFPQYGSHTIDIVCTFTGQADQVIVELLPEGQVDAPENRSTLHFTPDQPQKRWTWFADSPFAGGYRYRLRPETHAEPGEWSDIQSPFEPLILQVGPPTAEGHIPGDHLFGTLVYYVDGADPEHYFYIPGAPVPAYDPQGRPMLSLLISGEVGFLQMDVRWQAPVATLDELGKKIAGEHPQIDSALLRLSFAPVAVEDVELLLMMAGRDTVLTTSQASGVPPNSALFSVALDAEQQNLVIAALHERTGLLRVRYRATRSVPVTATITLEGDVQAALAELSAASTLEECHRWVTQAVAQEQLQQTRAGSPLAPAALWQRAKEEALNQAAEWLYRHVRQTRMQPQSVRSTRAPTRGAAMLFVTVTQSDTVTVPLERTADVGTWFSGSEGDDHIRVVA